MEISSGVDLWGPWIRVSLGKGRQSTGTPTKLACGPSICIKSMVECLDGQYLAPRCEHVRMHVITLRKDLHV
jgi:hypothetical protein